MTARGQAPHGGVAVLAIGVADFERRAARDPEGTRAALRALHLGIVKPVVAGHGGRFYKAAGAVVLAVVPGVPAAIRTALDIHAAGAAPMDPWLRRRPLAPRIGLCVGSPGAVLPHPVGALARLARELERAARPGATLAAADVLRAEALAGAAVRPLGLRRLDGVAAPVDLVEIDGLETELSGASAP